MGGHIRTYPILTFLDIVMRPVIITIVVEGQTSRNKGQIVKRIVVVAVLLMLSAGCKKPTGPQTTEIDSLPAPSRSTNELMPAGLPTETYTGWETTAPRTVVEPPAPPTTRTHTVRKGDTLWSIAKECYGDGKRWKEIAAANDIANESKLPVGKVLRIP